MKLQTSIQPRRDGTVILKGHDGQNYVFAADEEGELTCEVKHEPTVAHALAGGLFYPADAQDVPLASDLVAALDGESAHDDADDGADDEGSIDSPPIEANTPPARRKPGPKPRNPAAAS